VRDVAEGIYVDPSKMHVLDHKGKYLSVRGPLNIARPIQGWPVIVQAGASEAGRQLAAETAELVFAAESTLPGAKAFYADVKGRAEKIGRNARRLPSIRPRAPSTVHAFSSERPRAPAHPRPAKAKRAAGGCGRGSPMYGPSGAGPRAALGAAPEPTALLSRIATR